MAEGGDKKLEHETDDESLPDFIEEDEDGDALDDDDLGDLEDEEEGLAAAAPEPSKRKRKRKSSSLPDDDGDSAPTRKAPAPTPDPDDVPFVVVKPHSEGLFEAVAPPGDASDYDFDETFAPSTRNKIALALIVVILILTGAVLAMVATDAEKVAEMRAFFAGEIVEHKTAEVKKLKAKWRDEDMRARNKYGDVTLTYFPADLTVEVTKITFHQGGAAWRRQEATKKETNREVIPNDTSKLKEGQTIERLPLLNLPVFETSKVSADDANAAQGGSCDPACADPTPYCIDGQCLQVGSVREVNFYEYQLKFTRDGYHPVEKTIRADDWQRVGPGNMIIEWPGLDLVPKPETVMANFAKAMGEIFCLMKLKNIATLQEASANENFEMLLIRNGFKTKESFEEARQVLTGGEHAAWWAERQKEISEQKCVEGE